MDTPQPKWELIGIVGDVDPIEHGGALVFKDITGTYPEEAEVIMEGRGDKERQTVRFVLDRLKMVRDESLGVDLMVPIDYDPSWPHPLEAYQEWFDESLSKVGESNGIPEGALRKGLCSDDAIERTIVYMMIGQYHGFENLEDDIRNEYVYQLKHRWRHVIKKFTEKEKAS